MEENQNENNQLDIPLVEAAIQFDPSEFEGSKVKIAKVEKGEIDSHYVPEMVDGRPTGQNVYDASRTAPLQVVYIITEPVTKISMGDGTDKEIIVKQMFTLQERINGDGTKEVVISKHPKAKLFKFLRKMGVEKLSDLIGKIVTLTVEPSRDPEDDRKFLRVVV